MSTPVEQIKARMNIVDVVGGYVRLTKAGSAHKGLCPFHTEKTPSFTVSPTRQTYHCFGCDRGGDIFSFIQEIEGLDFPGALKVLAEKAGVELKREDRKATTERERLYSVMETATRFYLSRLKPGSPAYAYLTDRGLTPETIANFRIGFAPGESEGWRTLSDALNQRGIKDTELERAGLSKKSDKEGAAGEGRYYDRFRSRIMFPIFDSSGRVIAFSGRIFGVENPEVGKYINSPETPLYDKSTVLFGFDKAKTAIRKQNFAVVVEGQMDLIMAHQTGTENTVAVSGTALTERHLGLVKRLTPNLVFAFDSDIAGVNATSRAFILALGLEMNVRVAKLPGAKDPADLIKEDPSAWTKAIAESKHVIDFLLDAVVASGGNALETRKAVEEKVLPFVARIRSSIEQAHFILEIARKIGLPDSAVWESLGKVRLAAEYGLPKPKEESIKRQVSMEEQLKEEIRGLILWREGEKKPGFNITGEKERFIALMGTSPGEGLSEAERNHSLFRVEQTYDPGKISDKLLDDLFLRYEIAVNEGRQADIHRMLAKAEAEQDKENIGTYLQEFQNISKRLHELKGKANAY